MPFNQFLDSQYSIVFKQRIRPNEKKTKNLYYLTIIIKKITNGNFDLKGHKNNLHKGDDKNNVIMA